MRCLRVRGVAGANGAWLPGSWEDGAARVSDRVGVGYESGACRGGGIGDGASVRGAASACARRWSTASDTCLVTNSGSRTSSLLLPSAQDKHLVNRAERPTMRTERKTDELCGGSERSFRNVPAIARRCRHNVGVGIRAQASSRRSPSRRGWRSRVGRLRVPERRGSRGPRWHLREVFTKLGSAPADGSARRCPTRVGRRCRRVRTHRGAGEIVVGLGDDGISGAQRHEPAP